MSQYKIYVLDRDRGNNPIYSSWLDECSLPYEVVRAKSRWCLPDDAGLIVTHYHYQTPEVSVLRRLRQENRVPILILSDGILEFRNTWDHPGLPAGSIFQPIMGHKLATIGQSQARVVESWGNPVGSCEVIGLPKCDPLIGRTRRIRPHDEPAQVLVCTARTPGFTSAQKYQVERSLRDLKEWFDRTDRCVPIWRLTDRLDRRIGVKQTRNNTSGIEMHDLLRQIDAVVTTPSTVMLEAAMHDLPVAKLDYNNCPSYVPAAWNITAPKHISAIMESLLCAPAAYMTYQLNVLHDALECSTPATPRLLWLMERMLQIGSTCRTQNQPVQLPPRIVRPFSPTKSTHDGKLPMSELYPDNDVFRHFDERAVQVELNHFHEMVPQLEDQVSDLQRENEDLKRQLHQLQQQKPAA